MGLRGVGVLQDLAAQRVAAFAAQLRGEGGRIGGDQVELLLGQLRLLMNRFGDLRLGFFYCGLEQGR